MSTLPTGTVTFLFTDLEGSTQLWETHPDAMRADLARHDALLRAAIHGNGGHIFNTSGDAFCAAFATAHQGLAAALDAQRGLCAEAWTVAGPGLRARLGLHTGEAQEQGGDYFGPTLNRTARLMGIAHGGQAVLSQAVELLVRDALPAGTSLRDLGSHRLKDLLRPEQVFQLHHPDLPGDFPPLRSLNSSPHNLPQRLDSFIGRVHALAQVRQLLSSSRLLTLTGVGGAGKTRLAQQSAAECLDRYPEGVWLAPLEALTDPALVPQAVAAAVGVREQPGQTMTATLCAALQGRRLLILLDNCEHLVGACARLAQTVLEDCPLVQILATSREALAIPGETTYAVPTLPVPEPRRFTPSGGPQGASEAMRLFADRAAQSLPSFALTAENSPAVAGICRQLDGIPLAIELAAPRVKTLTLEQISQRLDKRFRLLTGGSRTALPRQQTMQAAIQWSHDLLSWPERVLFRRLSIFSGGWTLEAAEAICCGNGLEDCDVMDLLSSLVAKSLVQAEEREDGGRRYRMLETLREYSLEQSLVSPGADAVRDRHRDWFLALAERTEPELRGPQQGTWLDCLEMEHDNFRAALAWSDAEHRLRLGAALQSFWLTRGFLSEGREVLESALLGDTGSSPDRAKALKSAGVLAWSQADYQAAERHYRQSLLLYREGQNKQGVAMSLKNLGIVSDFQRDYQAAYGYYQESLAIFREIEDTWSVSSVLLNLGAHFIERDRLTEAKPFLEESLSHWRRLGDHSAIALTLCNLGRIAHGQGDFRQSRQDFIQSIQIQQKIKDQRGVASSLFHLACMEAADGQDERAALLLGVAESIRELADIPFQTSDEAEYVRVTDDLKGRMGRQAHTSARGHGMRMAPDQALRHAYGGGPEAE